MKSVLRSVLAVCAMTLLASTGCNKGNDSPGDDTFTGPSAVSAPAPVAANPAPNPTPAAGVVVDVLSSTFDPDRCTLLTDPKYAGLTELVHKVKITNNSGGGIYSKPAIYFSSKQTCGAHAENPGSADANVTGAKTLENGASGDTTYTFPINDRMCGSYQLDDTWRGQTNVFVIGKVINTGIDCPSCEGLALQVTVTGSGLTRTVKVTFKGEKPNKKAKVSYGDGTSDDFANGDSKSHTWPYGDYTVTATFENSALPAPCITTQTVSNSEPDSCENLRVSFSFATESVNAAVVASTYSQCFQGSWVNPGTGSLDFGDATNQGVSNPFSQCHNYTQTSVEQNLTAKLTVVRGQLSCPKTLAVKIPPKQDTCENYPQPSPPPFGGALALTGQTSTQVTVTSGSVTPAGGAYNPTLPANVARPAYGSTGSFLTTYTVSVPYGPENLRCSKRFDHDYSISLPPQECNKVNDWTLKNERHDGTYTIVVVTNKNSPATSIVESFDLSGGQSAHFDGYSNTTLHAFFKLPKTSNLYWYDGKSGIQNDCADDGGTYYANIDSRTHVCATPNNHGNDWNYDNDEDADLYKTTQVANGYSYDFADSETSGSCGAVAASGVEAQWQGDAKLSVNCVCPVR